MANPNLFAAYLRPPKSVLEYGADLDAAEQNALNIEAGRRKNELAALVAAQQRAQMTEADADRNALQRIASAWGADTTPEQRIASLRGSGRAALMNQADTLEKGWLDRRNVESQIGERGVKADKERIANGLAHLQAVAQLTSGVVDQATYDQARQRAAQAFGPEFVAKMPAVFDPAEFARGRQQAQTIEQQLAEEWKRKNYDLDVRKQGEVEANNVRTDARVKAEGAANRAVQIRGQDQTNARALATLEQGKAPPAGYRKTADGNLEAIPGGPADLKIQGQLNVDTQALNGSIAGFDRLATAANEVLNHPGLKGITGMQGAFPNVPGGQAANAEALLGTLKSQVGFGVLQDMRNNSKTGGALGSISDAEGKRLEANLAALEKSQSLEQYQANLRKIVDYAEQAKERVREAYNMKHSGKAGAAATSAPTVQPGADLGGGFTLKR